MILPNPGEMVIIPETDDHDARAFFLEDPDSFLLTRGQFNEVVTTRKAVRQCTDALAECEHRECESAQPAEMSILGSLQWPITIAAFVIAAAGGVAVGYAIFKE